MPHSMLRRCFGWDYCSPAIYMITLTQEDRRHPLLGKLVIDTPSASPEMIEAHIEPSALGNEILSIWKHNFPDNIQPLYLQLMEEHLHGILYVKDYLTRPLGKEIAAFKAFCYQIYRKMFSTATPLFSRGYQDTILFRKGQLDRMFRYLADNPRRLAVKRLFPNLFHINRFIPFESGYLNGIGNNFLLQAARFHQIQVSRSVNLSSPEFETAISQLRSAVQANAVIVSPCISPGEKELAHIAFAENMPLIVLRNNVFPELYKPQGKYFDACANGLLLMLAPPGFGYKPEHRVITRQEACILNCIAQKICGEDALPIVYHHAVPENLEWLVTQSLRPL